MLESLSSLSIVNTMESSYEMVKKLVPRLKESSDMTHYMEAIYTILAGETGGPPLNIALSQFLL